MMRETEVMVLASPHVSAVVRIGGYGYGDVFHWFLARSL